MFTTLALLWFAGYVYHAVLLGSRLRKANLIYVGGFEAFIIVTLSYTWPVIPVINLIDYIKNLATKQD